MISADAAVSLTDDGSVAIQLIAVRAGALPLPVLQLADELAGACQKLNLPVRWTRQDGKPVALVESNHASRSMSTPSNSMKASCMWPAIPVPIAATALFQRGRESPR